MPKPVHPDLADLPQRLFDRCEMLKHPIEFTENGNLKKKHPAIDPMYFDELAQIKDMTSDKVHEQSWDKWDSKKLRLLLGVMKAVFYEMYVEPAERKERAKAVAKLREDVARHRDPARVPVAPAQPPDDGPRRCGEKNVPGHP